MANKEIEIGFVVASHESVIGGGGDFYNDGSIGAGDLDNYGSSTNDALRKSSLSPERSLSKRTLSIYSSNFVIFTPHFFSNSQGFPVVASTSPATNHRTGTF